MRTARIVLDVLNNNKTTNRKMMEELETLARGQGAKSVPFSDGNQGFESDGMQACRRLMDQNAALRGVMLLTGKNGTGKSTLVRKWKTEQDPRRYEIVYLTQASVNGNGLLSLLVDKLGKEAGNSRARNLKRLEEALLDLQGKTLLILLDEAQNYNNEALEGMRMLLELNEKERVSFGLFLIGDEYLSSNLRLRCNNALYSRIGVQYELKKWSRTESEAYLLNGLNEVGLAGNRALDQVAIDLLHEASEGNVRTLENLGKRAWIDSAKRGSRAIDAEAVSKALEEVPCHKGGVH